MLGSLNVFAVASDKSKVWELIYAPKFTWEANPIKKLAGILYVSEKHLEKNKLADTKANKKNKIKSEHEISNSNKKSKNTLSFVLSGESYIFNSTAYSYSAGNKTATGVYPKRGIVAVDPKVIPLGTKLYIEGYGYAVAADTGGVIKGKIIDVFLPTEKECYKWGRKKVKVTICK